MTDDDNSSISAYPFEAMLTGIASTLSDLFNRWVEKIAVAFDQN